MTSATVAVRSYRKTARPLSTVLLANVELALTISGISGKERRERAIKALEEVGLGDQLHKKPNQMSGGQMQRVSLARALVNNPDILLDRGVPGDDEKPSVIARYTIKATQDAFYEESLYYIMNGSKKIMFERKWTDSGYVYCLPYSCSAD